VQARITRRFKSCRVCIVLIYAHTYSLRLQIHDTYYLVAIIDNDYVDCTLFDIFDEIIAEDASLKKETEALANSMSHSASVASNKSSDGTWF